jgi:hypothetical protein
MMKKILRWYALLLKMKVKSPGCYLELLAMALLVLFVSGIHFPTADNVEIGIVVGDSQNAASIYEKLNDSATLFAYREETDAEELKTKVESGEYDSGFVFADDFDERCEEQDLSGSVNYYCSGTTTKGAVAKESLYAAILEVESRFVLSEAEYKLYGDNDEERLNQIMEKFTEYVDSDEVFGIAMHEVEIETERGSDKEEATILYPVQGCVGILVFLIIFLYGLKKFENGYAYPVALTKREASVFSLCGHLASGTVSAIFGLILVALSGQSRGFGTEFVRMILLVISSAVWGLVASRIFRSYVSFLAQVLIIVLANVLLCPVIFDIVTYVRAFGYIRLLFPLSMYIG